MNSNPPLILKTIAVDHYGIKHLYFATSGGTIDPHLTSIWQQLTGRKTLRDNDLGLIADLTQGLVRVERK